MKTITNFILILMLMFLFSCSTIQKEETNLMPEKKIEQVEKKETEEEKKERHKKENKEEEELIRKLKEIDWAAYIAGWIAGGGW